MESKPEISTKTLAETLKGRYGEIYEITVTDKDRKYTGYLKKPDIKALSETSRKALVIKPTGEIEQNMVEAGICLIDHCWIGGDEEIRKNDDLLFAACQVAYSLYQTKEAVLKKV